MPPNNGRHFHFIGHHEFGLYSPLARYVAVAGQRRGNPARSGSLGSLREDAKLSCARNGTAANHDGRHQGPAHQRDRRLRALGYSCDAAATAGGVDRAVARRRVVGQTKVRLERFVTRIVQNDRRRGGPPAKFVVELSWNAPLEPAPRLNGLPPIR